MKKINLICILVIYFSSFCFASDYSIKSLLGIPFGEICVIKAELVDKPNTYYAQNISHAEYYLKVHEINNRKLSEPLIVEPEYDHLKFEKNKFYILKAYETIQSQNEPRHWTKSKRAKQVNYLIIHKIVIKKP